MIDLNTTNELIDDVIILFDNNLNNIDIEVNNINNKHNNNIINIL